MNPNDPPKEEQRAWNPSEETLRDCEAILPEWPPATLLSDEEFSKMVGWGSDPYGVMDLVRNFYEAKITSGELMTKADHERILEQEKQHWLEDFTEDH